MTPAVIMQGMTDTNRLLSMKNDEYLKLSETKAQAERDYNVALAKETLSLKANGHSVTLIPTLAKGDKHVADLKLKFDIAVGIEKACLESIKTLRGAIDTYRSLLAWQKAEMTGQ